MIQAMILIGILAICAVSGVLLIRRSRWAPGPGEPTGSYTAPAPPLPSPPPVAAMPSPPPVTASMPGKPSPPLPPALSAAPPSLSLTPTPAFPVRRGRNNGFTRFTPAPVRARTGRA